VHNQLTASNSFERVVDGVRALCSARGERRWPLLELKVVVARENAGHLLALREIAAELQVDVFNVIAENHLPHLDRLTGTVRSLEQTPPFPAGVDASLLKKTLHTLFRQQGRPVLRLTPQWLPAEVFADHYRGLFDRTLFECRAPWYFAGITATGEVYACPYIRLGNVKQTPLAALFRGETIRQFRRALKERRIYAGCAGCCFLVYRPRRGRHGAIPVGTGAMEQLGSPPAAASLAQSRREAGPARASLLAPEDSRR
jgi:MoaA/NifB/PqqE/SkfB family radical SAM enzyme